MAELLLRLLRVQAGSVKGLLETGAEPVHPATSTGRSSIHEERLGGVVLKLRKFIPDGQGALLIANNSQSLNPENTDRHKLQVPAVLFA